MGESTRIHSHNLTKVTYNVLRAKDKKTHWSFMDCRSRNQPEEPYNYFCIDHLTWFLLTTTSYKPLIYVEEQFTLTLTAYGINSSGDKINQSYDVKILIKPGCAVEKKRYKVLAQTCTPPIKELRKTTFAHDMFIFTVPQDMTKKIIKIVSLNYTQSDIYTFRLICEGKFSTKDTGYNITKADEYSEATCGRNTEWIRFKSSDNFDGNLLKMSMVVRYYALDDFCGNRICQNQYRYWKAAASERATPNQRCVDDTMKLDREYQRCIGELKIAYMLIGKGYLRG